MGFYKVKPDRSISVSEVFYSAGQIVELSDKEAAYHAPNIELTSEPLTNDAVAIFNFAVPNNSDLNHEIGLGTKTLSIKNYTYTNPIGIETESAHQLTTGDKIYVYVARQLNNQKQSLISALYSVTVTGASTFTVPVDGSALPEPSEGFIDYLEDLSSSSFVGKIYRPKVIEKNYVVEGLATVENGSRFIKIEGSAKNLREGQLLSIDGVFTNNKILSVSDEPSNSFSVILVETPAAVSEEDRYASASEGLQDFDQKGDFIGNLLTEFSLSTLALSIKLPFSDYSGTYLYEITENTTTFSRVILKGLISYV